MTPRTATVLAQAKINLFLRILAREASGFHQLETLLCRIDLADRVTLTTDADENALTVTGPALPDAGLGPAEQNLAWRAAVAYQGTVGWPAAFRISIEKHIPVGGGLGGGSADAGAVLRLLNTLAPEPLDSARLLELAGSLGADVPFLTQDQSTFAIGWGRGDRLLALPPLPTRGCVLFTFPFGVNTGEAYSWIAVSALPPAAVQVFSPADLSYWEGVDQIAVNDFEAVVVPRFPQLQSALDQLSKAAGTGAKPRLTGSGSTLFMLGPPQAHLPARLLALETDDPAELVPVPTATSEAVSRVEILA